MQDDLKSRNVKLLLYNSQVSDALTERLRAVAQAAKVPVVGVSETLPPGKTYQEWIAAELDAVDAALAGSST
jgi:zinc/manganese transport system substrate-binding protein